MSIDNVKLLFTLIALNEATVEYGNVKKVIFEYEHIWKIPLAPCVPPSCVSSDASDTVGYCEQHEFIRLLGSVHFLRLGHLCKKTTDGDKKE